MEITLGSPRSLELPSVLSYFCKLLALSQTFKLTKREEQRKPADEINKLSILYYPTLVWAFIDKNIHGDSVPTPEREETQDEEVVGEREPLLRS
jgi:hypothetical protein